MRELFGRLRPRRDENLLVGIETNDDAAVYRIRDDAALVLTADFISPFTEDPYLFGQVAAANSISDVYAMGGRPILVLNLCMFPARGVDARTLAKVLQGGLDKTEEAGALLGGGHTVQDDAMKYGLAVAGLVHPGRTTPNAGARPGDRFILTKPVGSGVYINGAAEGLVTDEEIRQIGRVMACLNKAACETMMEFGAGGATDITGFGLAGHSLSMAQASGIGIRFFYDAVPKFPRSLDLIGRGVSTGLTEANRRNVAEGISFKGSISDVEKALFWDPQTSGGLFFGVRAGDAEACLRKLHERGVPDARIVAEAFPAAKPCLEVVRA